MNKYTSLKFASAATIVLCLIPLSSGFAKGKEYSSEYELLSSLDSRLKAADKRLNDSYQKLLRETPETDSSALKKLQQAWLKRRDRYCNLNYKNLSRRKWMQAVSENPAQALCVITFSDLRARELQHLIATSQAQRKAVQPKGRQQYSIVNETWGNKLNLAGRIPEGQFQAFYIDTNYPDLVVAQEAVDSVAINYIYDKFNGIKSQDFGAYWVGRLSFDQPSTRLLALSLSWAKVRLIIDKQLVYEGGGSQELEYTFSPGEHLIEVEYVNNWHTTDFSMSVLPLRKKYSLHQVSAELTDSEFQDASILYASVYESSEKDQAIELKLGRAPTPVVLVLSSYGTVKWHIEKPSDLTLKAVVFGSHSPGSDISGDIDATLPILQLQNRVGSYRKLPSCSCAGGVAHCRDEGILRTKIQLETTFGLPLYGFAGKYSADTLYLPDTILDNSTISSLQDGRDSVHQDKLKCMKKGNPDFENFFPK